MYLEKILPEPEKEIDEFYPSDYVLKTEKNAYNIYTPKSRIPAEIKQERFSDYERIRTTFNPSLEALLIQ